MKLAEQEAARARQKKAAFSLREWLGNLVPRSPAWRTGENVNISISFRNVTSQPLQIEAFPPEIEISGSAPSSQAVRSFPAGESARLISAGEVAGYTLTWDQRTDDGKQAAPGEYTTSQANVQPYDGNAFLSQTACYRGYYDGQTNLRNCKN